MGLDMYLFKRTYVQNFPETKGEERSEVSVTRGSMKIVDPEKVVYVIEEVAYWRKANMIHGWFVENVMDNDDGKEYPVSRKQLAELCELCNTVLCIIKTQKLEKDNWNERIDNVEEIARLLPTCPGFFFGSLEYGPSYIADVQNTYKMLSEILENDNGEGTFFYYASW